MTAYLDHAATSPLRPAAFEAMLPHLTEAMGNPTGSHGPARLARKAVDDARANVAALCGAQEAEVVFTSGGTEADNLAVFGSAAGGTVVGSAIEHHAVLDPVSSIGGRLVRVGADGLIDLEDLQAQLDETVTVVSVMLANNETGVIQPLHKVARLVRKLAPRAVLHTDAVQAAPWLDLPRLTQWCDLVSLSAHKLGGPMGVGALVVRKPAKVSARILGGGQEQERRSGTHNVAGIAGFGAAAAEAMAWRNATSTRVAELRDALVRQLQSATPGVHVTAAKQEKLPNIAHMCIEGVESEALLVLLDDAGVSASAGASCSSGALQVSHVLTAMGVAESLANGVLRLSLGWNSSDHDVEIAVKAVNAAVERLRETS